MAAHLSSLDYFVQNILTQIQKSRGRGKENESRSPELLYSCDVWFKLNSLAS